MQYPFGKFIGFLGILILGFHCTPSADNGDLKAFYYPVKSLQEGLIYEYIPLNNDSFTKAFWYLRATEKKGSWYLSGLYLEEDYLPHQRMLEKVVSNGVLSKEVALLLQDTSGLIVEVDASILSGNVFSFKAKKYESVLLSKIQFEIPDEDHYLTTVIKNRQYEGDTTINIGNNEYQTARFGVKELVSFGNEKVGYAEPEFSGVEHYGKDLGLVYYKKETEGKILFEYGLNKRYPIEEASEALRLAIENYYKN